MKYRITAFIALVIMLLISVPAFSTLAAPSAQITVETNKMATVGNTFAVKIELEENPGFAELTLNLTYDTDHMTLERVELSSELEQSGVTLEKSANIKAHPYVMSFESKEDVTKDGTLVTAYFTLDSADLGVDYEIEVDLPDGAMISANGSEIKAKTEAGGVRIDCYHSFTSQTYEPRCDAEGYTEYACTECQKRYQGDFVAPTPHNWKTVSSKAPTCTENGTLTRKCRECSYQETVSNGEASGHSYAEGVTTEPTCDEQGYTLHKCKNCTFEYSDSFTAAVGHTYEANVIYDSTCTSEGLMTFVCSTCNAKKEYSHDNIIPKRNCDYVMTSVVAPTHEKRGYSVYECAYCKALTKKDYTDVLPYQMEYQIVTMPTCTEEGLRHGSCADGCGHETQEVIEPTGHEFNDWETVKQPTVSEKGLRSRVCAHCSFKETDEIPMIVNGSAGIATDLMTQLSEKLGLSVTQLIIILIALGLVLLVILLLIIFLAVVGAAGKKRARRSDAARKAARAADLEALRSVTAAAAVTAEQEDAQSAPESAPEIAPEIAPEEVGEAVAPVVVALPEEDEEPISDEEESAEAAQEVVPAIIEEPREKPEEKPIDLLIDELIEDSAEDAAEERSDEGSESDGQNG